MSHNTAEKLNLIKINKKAVIANVVTNSNAGSIAKEFADRFEGLCKLAKVQVQLNSDVPPVIHPHRRISFHLCQKVNDELQHLEDMDVIGGRMAFHQYMPAKPIKWGVKMWALAESDTGYLSKHW